MNRFLKGALVAGLGTGLVACSDSPTDTGALSTSTAIDAYSSVPFGFDNLHTSFAGASDDNGLMPEGPGGPRGPHGRGGEHGRPEIMGGPHDGGLMGGGLGGLFLGGGFEVGFGHGRFGFPEVGEDCAFNATTGRVECPDETRAGLTVTRSVSFATADGTVQEAFDSATNTVNLRESVSGSVTRRDNEVSTVDHASERTVSGLVKGSTQRTVNGTSAGTETTTGTRRDTAFTITRVAGDTITNLVVPVPGNGQHGPFYPISGSVVRSMTVTATLNGGSPTVSSRREVLTYDGSDTATLVITQDGTTKNCTVDLPHGRPVCQE